MKRRLYILLLIILASFSQAFSQNNSMTSNPSFIKMSFNPAFTGTPEKINALLLVRKQWMGIERSPSTQVLNCDLFNEAIGGGLGLYMQSNRVGYETSTDFKFTYAVHQQITKKATLSLGTGLGFLSKSLDGTQLRYKHANDPNAVYSKEGKTGLAIDIGIQYYTKSLKAGLSSTYVNKSKNKTTVFNVPRMIHFYSEYTHDINDLLKAQALVYLRNNVNTQASVGANVIYQERFRGGLLFRQNDAIAVLLGMQINNRINLGYSYDIIIGEIGSYNSGSHEIFIHYCIDTSKPFIYFKSPRLFN